MKKYFLKFFTLVFIFPACGKNLSMERITKDNRQDYLSVLSVDPDDGSSLNDFKGISVTFSDTVTPESISSQSFLILKQETANETLTTKQIQSQIEKGTMTSLAGTYLFSSEGNIVHWFPEESLEEGESYQVFLLPSITSTNHYPLNQDIEEIPTFFESTFTLRKQTEESSSEESTFTDEIQTTPQTTLEETSSFSPSTLMIHELFYDAQEIETDGSLFIELYGTPGANLTGYVIRFINGANGKKTDEFVFPANSLIPEDGYVVLADTITGDPSKTMVENADYLDNFDPQNGPDAVLLLDPSGNLVDVLGYGEGMVSLDEEGYPLLENLPASLVKEAGQSLSRQEAGDTENNFLDFFVNTEPSPGSGVITVLSQEIDSDSSPLENNSTDLTETNTIPEETIETPDAESTISDLPQSSNQNNIPPEIEATVEESVEDRSELENTEIEQETTPLIEEQSIIHVRFTEVVTDPQKDWNDTMDGDGILFNKIVGYGTVGSTDEWIELYNDGNLNIDMTGWTLQMLDGTDETEILASSKATFLFSEEGSLTNFQVGEIMVLGNPTGDMKNTITLKLLDEDGDVIDSLEVPDGNATGITDESYQVEEDGNWSMGMAEPLEL